VNGLLDHHAELLRASAIAEEVAQQRGYWSATAPRQLERLFGGTQRKLVPALVIPTLDVRGEVCFCQLRPDSPRVIKGRTRKYELPWQAKMALDVPPAARDAVGDPRVPLLVTEGVRKGDSAVSAGLCAIDLVGVWTWRGRNEHDGLAVLSDWEYIALNGRDVFLAFDSDAMTKREVHAALERLWRLLSGRGARLRVVYLPSGEFGAKTGLDDYLAADHDRDDLLALAVDELRPLVGHGAPKAPKPAQDAALRQTAELLRAVRDVLAHYVILPSAAARLAIALYVLHTWALAGAHCTPYLVVQSAVKRSGKSRLEEVLEMLVRRPWRIAAASESAMFRKISAEQPTLLLDEVDALFGRGSQGTEPIRAILNAGNRPGASVARTVGEGAGMQVVDFSVYCPKVLAGIITRDWPDTVLDRSIAIPLQRKKRGEKVKRLRFRKLRAETESLRAELARWAQEHADPLLDADPDLPAALDDRAAEGWEPLFAIADLAEAEDGGPWGQLARNAAVQLAGSRAEDDAHGVLALAAIEALFAAQQADELRTAVIVGNLNEDDTAPFGGYRNGEGINARGLAKLLRPFAIGPRDVGPETARAKGYRRSQFEDAWARYCDPPPSHDADPRIRAEPSNDGRFDDFPIRAADPSCADSETPESPVNTGDCADARIETPRPGGNTNTRPGTVDDLTDEELLAVPRDGSIELPGDIAPCSCRQRPREWRLRGHAVNATYTYLSAKAYREAAARVPQNGCGVLAKGPASGWAWEATPLEYGHGWQCGLCHPPAAGLDVEWREAHSACPGR
jgi:hypothetical protein